MTFIIIESIQETVKWQDGSVAPDVSNQSSSIEPSWFFSVEGILKNPGLPPHTPTWVPGAFPPGQRPVSFFLISCIANSILVLPQRQNLR